MQMDSVPRFTQDSKAAQSASLTHGVPMAAIVSVVKAAPPPGEPSPGTAWQLIRARTISTFNATAKIEGRSLVESDGNDRVDTAGTPFLRAFLNSPAMASSRLARDRERVYTVAPDRAQQGVNMTERSGEGTEEAKRIPVEAPDVAEAKVVPVRLPEKTVARVDAHRERLRQLTGLEPSRSEVIRMLVERGLTAVEAEAQPSRKR
jgi:hypothetical protein